MKPALRLTVRVFLLVLPVLALLIIINRIVDPGMIYRKHTYEEKLAGILLSGNNAIINSNYNDHIVQKLLINGQKTAPEVVVLGSSRIMQLEQNFFCGHRTLNNAVVKASLEDIISVYGLYAEKGFFPKKVLINIEPEYFCKSTDPSSWLDISSGYLQMLTLIHLEPEVPVWKVRASWFYSRTINLVSFSYFTASIHRIIHNYINRSNADVIIATRLSPNKDQTRLSDGSMAYNEAIRNQTVKQRLESTIATSENLIRLTDFETDPYKIRLFEKFIAFLKSKNTEVILTITPYHPLLYSRVRNNPAYQFIPSTDNYIRNFAERNNIKFAGSTNPAIYNNPAEDFTDGFHLNKEALYRLLKSVSGCL